MFVNINFQPLHGLFLHKSYQNQLIASKSYDEKLRVDLHNESLSI